MQAFHQRRHGIDLADRGGMQPVIERPRRVPAEAEAFPGVQSVPLPPGLPQGIADGRQGGQQQQAAVTAQVAIPAGAIELGLAAGPGAKAPVAPQILSRCCTHAGLDGPVHGGGVGYVVTARKVRQGRGDAQSITTV